MRAAAPVLSQRQIVEIEQGVARGWDVAQISRRLGYSAAAVVWVRGRMDVINGTADMVPDPRRTVDEAMREELACIYSATVPEHSTGGFRRRGRVVETRAERARLDRAVRRLRDGAA